MEFVVVAGLTLAAIAGAAGFESRYLVAGKGLPLGFAAACEACGNKALVQDGDCYRCFGCRAVRWQVPID